MPTSALARSAAILAALALGITCVPELTDAATATSAAPDAPAAVLGPTAVVAAPTPAASSSVARPVAPVRPDLGRVLPRDLSGTEVLAQQPDVVPEIARRSNVPRHQLLRMLRDGAFRVSPGGRTYVQEDAPARTVQNDGQRTTTSDPGPIGSVPVMGQKPSNASTFTLESRPGATRTIFLDFDGADVRGTLWNTQGGLPERSWPGITRSGGDVGGYSSGEHAFMQEVWRQVAESYAPFDVNVTTVDRGKDAWNRSSSTDPTYGSRVVITDSTEPRNALCGPGCGGTAWVGTFSEVDPDDDLQVAWVFSNGLSATQTAQSVSHEVGHNLGLAHDGSATEGDYSKGSPLWGPIMGSAINRAISHWSKGEYAGATNTQDDIAVMTRRNLPLAADDHGDDAPTARVLGQAAAYDIEGVVGTRTDADVFRVDLGCGTKLDARVQGIGRQSALDLRLTLLDAAGAAVTTDDPRTQDPPTVAMWDSALRGYYSLNMSARLTKDLPAGTYFLRVDGVGQGDPKDMSSGYSDYGSLGRYRLTSTGCPTTAPPSTEPPTATPPTTAPPTTAPPTTTPPSTPPTSTAPATAPSAPTLGAVTSGTRGRPISVTMSWTAPTSTGGSAITGYKITAYKLNRRNATVRTYTASVGAGATTVQVGGLAKGRYKLVVQAVNSAGTSVFSATSGIVTAR